MRKGIVVQKLHRNGRRQLLRWLEEADEQRGPDEVVHQALAHFHPNEKLVGGHSIVGLESLLVAREVKHGIQQPDHRQPVSNWQALEAREAGHNLTQWARQLRKLRVAEDRGSGLQSIGTVERRLRELGEDLLHIHANLLHDGLDVWVVLPEATRADLEWLARGCQEGRGTRGVGDAVQQRDVATVLTQRLGGTPTAPAGANDNHPRLPDTCSCRLTGCGSCSSSQGNDSSPPGRAPPGAAAAPACDSRGSGSGEQPEPCRRG
mmetsp:Transcript_12447/g.43960  ORF Transcript_12447/g.43960 Transcript_12447/m.43960 type:complete len:263 (-) Transcript_12447:185-973(-)